MKKRLIQWLFSSVLLGLVLINTSCEKEDSSEETINPLTNTVASFSGKIDTTRFSFIESNKVMLIDSVDFSVGVGLSYRTFSSALLNIETGEILEVVKGRLATRGELVNLNQIEDFFKQGEVEYSADAHNGIEVNWYDEDGKLWSTSNIPGYQDSCLFTISNSYTEATPIGYISTIEVDFNCIVYDDNQQALHIDGRYIGKFKEYNR